MIKVRLIYTEWCEKYFYIFEILHWIEVNRNLISEDWDND